jgi:hypothetical protein
MVSGIGGNLVFTGGPATLAAFTNPLGWFVGNASF